MFFVYILYSQKDGRLYIGYSADLDERLKRHRVGEVPATKDRRPFLLIGYEAFFKESDAKRRERFLKGGKGREQLKVQYQDVFDELNYRFR
ncbi:GIY-YIG nuclease family protein [Candidatus Uhrbacteria bacterium]|nr:GIY-YIG nuclease family protein [Candidatus Uhrbacteria bacterium]